MKQQLQKITLLLLIQYFVVSFILILLYQGGSYFHHNLGYYEFTENYLSDLGRTMYFDDKENPFFIYYTLTLSLVGLGVMLFYYFISKLISNKLRFLIIILGIISGLAYIGIAFSPVDKYFSTHIQFGLWAYVSFFMASLLTNFSIDKKKYSVIFKYLSFLNVFLVLFLLLKFFGPSSRESLFALHVKVVAQKIIVGLQLLVAFFILLRIYKNEAMS